jgi:hypothetical protein
MGWNERLEELSKLPIFRFLDAIRNAFQEHGRVVVFEPRRIAATSLAARVAEGFLGEDDDARGVGRIAREVGARSWSQSLPRLPEAEEFAHRIQIQIQKGGEG